MKHIKSNVAQRTQRALNREVLPQIEKGKKAASIAKAPRLVVRIKLSRVYKRKPIARRYEHKSKDGSYGRKSITKSKKGYRVTFSKTFYLSPTLKHDTPEAFERLLASKFKRRYKSFAKQKRYNQFSGNVQYFVGRIVDPYTGRLSLDSQVTKTIPFVAVSKTKKFLGKELTRKRRVLLAKLEESEGILLDEIPKLFEYVTTVRSAKRRREQHYEEVQREKRKQERQEERETFMKKKKKQKRKK
jgi:hypothetical protein